MFIFIKIITHIFIQLIVVLIVVVVVVIVEEKKRNSKYSRNKIMFSKRDPHKYI